MSYDELEQVGEHRSAMIRFASNLARGRPIHVHRGSQRGWLHVLDAVRGIEAAGRVEEYAAINLGHPTLLPMLDLAQMVAAELDADPSLIQVSDLPDNMTLVKHPALARQRELLHFEPRIDIEEGVRRVCAVQARQAAAERAAAERAAAERAPAIPARARAFPEPELAAS
jgi:nucleoside-diphosphate-sugar epimerase